MAFGVKTANIYDLLEDNDTENVEPTQPEPKPAPAKQKETGKQGKFLSPWMVCAICAARSVRVSRYHSSN